MYDEDYEENVHYISDQDSTDDKPHIENIIKITSEKYQNESYIVKILLSEHYRDLRCKFFDGIRRTHKSIYQNIKKEIRNYLNPYRIFIDKKTEIPKEVKELYELLKGYYKERNFNNTFFINYFKDLEEAHKKKSKIISYLPTDEIETLNDIQRKVTIIKNLRHYLNTNVSDRIQTNFEQKKDMFHNDYFTMMYEYLVIDEEEFSKMDEKKLFEYLSNKRTSYKLRRPINDFNAYNYIPILCKGYCQEEAEMFIQTFNKAISNHVEKTECDKCTIIKENMSIINSQIRSIYLKTCVFSHNINEIMFHPLMFFSLREHLPFYQKQFNKKPIQEINKIVCTNEIPKGFKNIKNMDLQNIYNPSDVGMKKIYDLLFEYAKNKGIYGNCCYLSEYKTSPCPIEFKPNNNDYYTHMKNCPYYHSDLEKRRINKNMENEICKDVIKDGMWLVNDEEKIHCHNNNYCNKFHTRNELFFDEKNYRKLYPCTESSYCEKGDLCPKKHATDIKIEELYLPLEKKNELERRLMRLIEKNERIKRKIDLFSKVVCKSCLNYIDGEHGRNIYFFRGCNHVICSICFKYYQTCPLCGINEDDDDDNNGKNPKNLLIKVDEKIEEEKTKKNKKNKKNKNNKKNKKNKKKRKNSSSSSNESDEEEKNEEKEEEEEDEEEDKGKEDDGDSSNSSSSSSEDEYSNKDRDLSMKEENDVDPNDSNLSIHDIDFPEDNITFSKDINKKSEDENAHNNKGRRRGKGTQNNNNNHKRRNNNYNQNESFNIDNSYRRGRRGNRGNRGRGQRGYRGGRGGYYNNNNYSHNSSYYSNYGNYDNYDNDDSYNYYNESSQASSNRRGKGQKRGGKSYFDDSNRYDNKNQYEEDQKSSDDNENENGSDNHDISMVRGKEKGRGNARGKGVVRGGKKVRGGKNRSDYKKEDSDESSDSNDNAKNSKQSSKINKNDDLDEQSD